MSSENNTTEQAQSILEPEQGTRSRTGAVRIRDKVSLRVRDKVREKVRDSIAHPSQRGVPARLPPIQNPETTVDPGGGATPNTHLLLLSLKQFGLALFIGHLEGIIPLLQKQVTLLQVPAQSQGGSL